jgi:integrase
MMTPLTLIIDRTFRGVGRIKKATGTTNPVVRRKMSRMLTELYETGRLDLLRDIRDNRRTLLEVLDAHQRKALDAMATGATAETLADAMRRWIDKQQPDVDYSEKHLESLGTSLGYLLALDENAKVNDLPELLEQLRDTVGKSHPRSFNLARSHASAFVRATLKRDHRLWKAVNAVEPRTVPKRPPRPDLTVEWMRNTFPHPETNQTDACAWAMALTGMGPKEYWGEWETKADRVTISGTKRKARVRSVPLVQPIAVPRMSRNAFRLRLYRKFDGRINAYDFRRTFARWMESAGILRARRKMYMGHAAGDVTALYEQHELDAYLAEDAKALRRFLELPDAAAQPLRKVE